MSVYKWEGVEAEGSTLLEAIKAEHEKSRDGRYTVLGKHFEKCWEEDYKYGCSKDTDDEYKDYCRDNGISVPPQEGETPSCKCCGHGLKSRLTWAADQANNTEEFNVDEWEACFEDEDDNEEVGKHFNICPTPSLLQRSRDCEWLEFTDWFDDAEEGDFYEMVVEDVADEGYTLVGQYLGSDKDSTYHETEHCFKADYEKYGARLECYNWTKDDIVTIAHEFIFRVRKLSKEEAAVIML